MWASSIIDSRGFRFHGEINLAPFSDMFNYLPHPEPRPSNGGNFFLQHHILTKDGLEVHADRNCESNLQLFEDYGDNSDRIYLQYHGFMPEKNPFRCIQIDAPPIDDPSIPLKKQKLLKEFRFKKGPSKCVDETGDLGQMLIVYLTLLSLNDEEEYRCLETINSDRKEWQLIQAACGILHTTNSLSTLLKSTPSNLDSNLQFRKNSLDERIHQQILSLFISNTKSFTQTTMRDDLYQILETKSQLKKEIEINSTNSSQFMKLIKKLNALNFRYYTKEHLWNICFKYGSNCNLHSPPPRTLTPLSLEDPINSISNSTSICFSDEENVMTCSTTSTSSTIIPSSSSSSSSSEKTTTEKKEEENGDLTISMKIKHNLRHIWNQTNEQKDQNLNLYLNEFNKWFNSNIHYPSRNTLLAKYIPGFRIGTITTQSLTLDEIYLAIPSTLIMDTLSAEKDNGGVGSILNNLLRFYNRKDDYHSLIFHLLYESFEYGSESLYWNYLRLLPSPKELDIPLFWTKEEIISRLGPSSLQIEMLEYKDRVNRNYQMLTRVPLLEALRESNILTEDTYIWATAILDSRSIWWHGSRHLVPMLDFINCIERMDMFVVDVIDC